jgi:hypothetical protein
MRPKNSASLMAIISTPKHKYRSVTPIKKTTRMEKKTVNNKDDGKLKLNNRTKKSNTTTIQ